jgi:hypothetical protein
MPGLPRLRTLSIVFAWLLLWPATAFAGGTNVAVSVIGVGTVTDNHELDCTSTGSRVDCDARYYNTGWDVTFTASASDSRWRFDGWSDDGPDKIGCGGNGTTCSFTSGACFFCAYDDHITATFVPRDDDGDGSNALTDCVDSNPAIHPGAPDVAHDGIDQDCAGGDNLDGDGDGHPSNPGPDCDDGNSAVHPGAAEVAGDGIDENCDGPPNTIVSSAAPAAGSVVRSTRATFAFASPPNPGWNAAFQCKLDSGAWTACTSPAAYANLSDGRHTFRVRGIDVDNRADGSPAEIGWTVDTRPPDTQILSGPAAGAITNATGADFAFGAESGARFECSLDDAPFRACSGSASHQLSGLGLSDHTLLVRAVDAAGNADPSPAGRTWRVTADADADGYVLPGDCDDGAAGVHPNAADVAHDGIDQNCDGRDNLDADGDGASSGPGPDCDDQDAGVWPTAADVPGDGIDQNCDGGDARFTQLAAVVGAQWRFSPFRFSKLYVKRVEAGSRIELRCHGRGCPFARRTIAAPRAHALLSVVKAVKNAKLRRGATLVVRVTKPGYDGVMRRYTVRGPARDPQAADFCLPAQGGRPAAC